MKFTVNIQSRWSTKVVFSAEVDAPENASDGVKLGLAVKEALKSGSDLRDSNLSGSDLSCSNLSGSDLSGSDLSCSNLSGSDLSGSDLRGSNLSGSDLSCSNLSDSNLRGSNLSGSNLSDSDLRGSNLSGSTMSDGLPFANYLRDVVPALLTAGGKSLEQIRDSNCWKCHDWSNCPMHVAFDVSEVSHMTGAHALYRQRATEFIQLFDARIVPEPDWAALIAARDSKKSEAA